MPGHACSRIIIEQAKGVLAERGGLTMDQAFIQLRTQARDTHQYLSDTARAIIERAAEMYSTSDDWFP
jgi:AmiR/NasT family two-component response regulator